MEATVVYEPIFVDQMPDSLEQGKLYINEQCEVAIHLCLCGCSAITVTPFHRPQDWKLVKEDDGTVSLIGSIGNFQFSCQSHYIMTRNIANFIKND